MSLQAVPYSTRHIIYCDHPTEKKSIRNAATRKINIFQCDTIHDILIYIQQDATLYSLFYLKTALHVSGGTTTLHQERKQLYL
jgi:glycerol-3-phosphate O-acyltransferase